MKKAMILLLIAAMVVMCGCSKKAPAGAPTADASCRPGARILSGAATVRGAR